ncbi:MAG: type I-B CRISPR-associated protein Cas5b [Elusimicrobiota bacterium]|nr:type I-B CRISPR-associated protein Cas5b [Endomicrobiia bacterium]MDW8166426.1 type I-B CRISPR-associated protein Cas5b [Elusimicrobiota bacterium]
MRLLKVKVFQLTANYRKPLSYNFLDTFPLPTYSNIRGWIHNILEAREYIPLSISIQGYHESIFYDLQTFYKFDRPEKERGIELPEFDRSVKKSPFYVATLYNINLILHIAMEYIFLEKIIEKIYDKYPSIGRYEDIARIDYINMVTIEKKNLGFEFYKIKYPIYLRKETAQRYKLIGINYRLPFKYEINQDIRYFNKIDVVYVEEGSLYGDIVLDSEGDLVELVGDYYE